MRVKTLSTLWLLPLLAVATQEDLERHEPYISDVNWHHPYKRSLPNNYGLMKRDLPFGDSVFNIYFCRGADQTDCDKIPISASYNCYNNQQWHGWTTTNLVPSSVKIDGPTCCAFFANMDCNKKAARAFEGYFTKVCEGDKGDAAKIAGKGNMMAYMCNIPYGSAGKNMASSPPNVIPIPTNLAPQQHG